MLVRITKNLASITIFLEEERCITKSTMFASTIKPITSKINKFLLKSNQKMKLSLDSLIFCEKKGEKKFGMARSVAGGGHHRQGRVCFVSLERENCQLNTQAIGEGESKRPC
jgi:hypothetical protein